MTDLLDWTITMNTNDCIYLTQVYPSFKHDYTQAGQSCGIANHIVRVLE